MGTIASGCPETYEEAGGGVGGDMHRRFEDMHQKLEDFRRGDVFASLAGVSQWWYNRGNSDVVIVIVLDVTNRENQLDQVPRVTIKETPNFSLHAIYQYGYYNNKSYEPYTFVDVPNSRE